MMVFNANIRTCNSFAESTKLCNSYFVAHTCICILFLPEQWKHCAKAICFYFIWYAHILSILYLFSLLMNKEEHGKKIYGLHYLFLSFCVIIFRVSGWIKQGSNTSKKEYDSIPRLFVFNRSLPSFWRGSSGSKRKHGSRTVSHPTSPLTQW